MARRSLNEWLSYQERVHPSAMDFTLDRIRVVLERLGALHPGAKLVVVGGTNGKGSVTAYLDAILRASGKRVGLYTSPHLLRYNERIRIDGAEIGDEDLVTLFERIESARGDISLTFFEYATAAACLAFNEAALDVWVLEVGLGGRLDAINVLDADVAVITSIGLDHCDYLGTSLEAIGREKAGIFRPDRTAIFGSFAMPQSVAAEAARLGARLMALGVDFSFARTADGFVWVHGDTMRADLPEPALIGPVQFENASTALAALDALGLLPDEQVIAQGLRRVSLPGRYQLLPGAVDWIFDVAHNPASVSALVATLTERPALGRRFFVLGLLNDKDASAVTQVLGSVVDAADDICAVTLAGERGRSGASLAELMRSELHRAIQSADSVDAGCARAKELARAGDQVVVFGSFLTVGAALTWHRLYCGLRN